MSKVDLHLHTIHSDGTMKVGEVINRAAQAGFSAIAITDHDCIDGVADAIRIGKEAGLKVVSGVELSAIYQNHDIHILGYFFDLKNEKLNAELQKFITARYERGEKIVEKLNKLGIRISFEDVRKRVKGRTVGRPHVAEALVKVGVCKTVREAFDSFLAEGKPAYVPKYKISVKDAIELIHQAGGIASLAHPGISRADDFIEQFAKWDLDAVEAMHSKHWDVQVDYFKMRAEQTGLLISGGSDCHGEKRGEPTFGPYFISMEELVKLEQLAENKKNKTTENN